MTPSTGVMEAMSTTPENAMEPATPTPTPTREVISGATAGRRARNITRSTIAAMTTPTTSPGPTIPSIEVALVDE